MFTMPDMKTTIETTIEERRHKEAEIFAALASGEKISDLRSWQKAKLLEDAKDCWLELSAGNLSESHRWAHYLINARLDNGRVDVSEFYKKLPHPVVLEGDSKSTTIRYDLDRKAESDGNTKSVFQSLWDVITLHPFPFRRCPVCRTIFVIAGKKKYCSPKCTSLSLGPRTDYMRNYMRKHRKKAKKKKG
jgi:hypothetical protein